MSTRLIGQAHRYPFLVLRAQPWLYLRVHKVGMQPIPSQLFIEAHAAAMPRVRAAERAGMASSERHYFSMRRAASDQVVAVTGASSGVGRAIARAFGAAGAKVGLIARGLEGLEACAREILRAGGEALVLPADVSDAAATENAARALVDRWGRIDTWVNNAMVSVVSPAMEMAPDELGRALEKNDISTDKWTRDAHAHTMPLNHGVILQIGSALVDRSIPLQSA